MRLAIATTETPHHAWFVRRIVAEHPVARVLCETKNATAGFETAHEFEKRRDAHERETWFDGRNDGLAAFAEVQQCASLNDAKVVADLRSIAPDVLIVFGTGILRDAVLEVCGERTINLHGGDPQAYRGLDTHLWAIYHGDFAALSTTLHTVNERLDDGRIIDNLPVPLHRGMELHELRSANTEVCVRLTLEALGDFQRRHGFASRPQQSAGRYYSHMPAILKDVCVQKFKRHTSTL